MSKSNFLCGGSIVAVALAMGLSSQANAADAKADAKVDATVSEVVVTAHSSPERPRKQHSRLTSSASRSWPSRVRPVSFSL